MARTRDLLLRLTALSPLLLGAACLAPPPPIVVETPFGAVHATTGEKAEEIAGLLEQLAPRVREMLPGSQQRAVDVWVQSELMVYRHRRRPESVRGFTLLSDEFHAKRIHLQEDGQSSWYLAHELVHALIGPSWRPLPGILEEGLGDVVAERLNPEYATHIRAHRLLNTSAVTGGFYVQIAYLEPRQGKRRYGPRVVSTTRVEPEESVPIATVRELFSTSRAELHQRWPEIPESFYGLAWLVVSRIVERHGLEGLHGLCLAAEVQGRELVPPAWLFAAADMDLEHLDANFLSSCFGREEIRAAAALQTELFTDLTLDLFDEHRSSLSANRFFYRMRPAFRLDDGSEVLVGSVSSLARSIWGRWR